MAFFEAKRSLIRKLFLIVFVCVPSTLLLPTERVKLSLSEVFAQFQGFWLEKQCIFPSKSAFRQVDDDEFGVLNTITEITDFPLKACSENAEMSKKLELCNSFFHISKLFCDDKVTPTQKRYLNSTYLEEYIKQNTTAQELCTKVKELNLVSFSWMRRDPKACNTCEDTELQPVCNLLFSAVLSYIQAVKIESAESNRNDKANTRDQGAAQTHGPTTRPGTTPQAGGNPVGEGGSPAVGDLGGPAVGDLGGTAVGDHGGPAVGDHGSPAAGDHGGPAVANHRGPAFEDNGGPAVANHGGPAFEDNGGPAVGDHGGPAVGDHGGPAVGDQRGPAVGDNGGPAVGDHGGAAVELGGNHLGGSTAVGGGDHLGGGSTAVGEGNIPNGQPPVVSETTSTTLPPFEEIEEEEDDESSEIGDQNESTEQEEENEAAQQKPPVIPEDGVQSFNNVVEYNFKEESPSGHFMAYFITAIVLCVAGYVIYHNKQKIFAIALEGRRDSQRRRPNAGTDSSAKYSKLQSTVEEVVPALEKSTTSKNYIY